MLSTRTWSLFGNTGRTARKAASLEQRDRRWPAEFCLERDGTALAWSGQRIPLKDVKKPWGW